MSCNGCRVLRKGCSDSCILRPCLSWIDGSDSQGHATVFVAKFFGRAGLFSFISAVPEPQRPALFRSLLFEACGRTVSPVHGAVGLLWSGNWRICQAAVETVLRGGTIQAIPELLTSAAFPPISPEDSCEADDGSCTYDARNNNNSNNNNSSFPASCDDPALRQPKRKKSGGECMVDLSLSLRTGIWSHTGEAGLKEAEKRRSGTPSRDSEESVNMTAYLESAGAIDGQPQRRLQYLFY
ncbi:hypothetical protein MLD38_031392 [Melastoma candidum]|uniref:Uncharacterized protein n=1 Tax=Melastoma candidum TaxID=119954 RepID=A0ACB9MPK0_9MYRT|nr:hypothetical protein MLD38_031392 [Melastoma candidum]